MRGNGLCNPAISGAADAAHTGPKEKRETGSRCLWKEGWEVAAGSISSTTPYCCSGSAAPTTAEWRPEKRPDVRRARPLLNPLLSRSLSLNAGAHANDAAAIIIEAAARTSGARARARHAPGINGTSLASHASIPSA